MLINLLKSLAVFAAFSHAFGQFGVYSPDLWVTIDTTGPVIIGDTIQFSLNVDEFEPDTCEGNSVWMKFDGLLLDFVGSEKVKLDIPLHIPSPYGGSFKPSDSLLDFPMGWAFDLDSNNFATDDIGFVGSGDWDFSFSTQITENYSRIDVYFYSEYDFFAVDSGCGIPGVPDGPYIIWEMALDSGVTNLFKELKITGEYKYFDLQGNELPKAPFNELYIEQSPLGVRCKRIVIKN